MISIKKSAIPNYLKSSDFYRSLDDEEDEEITIPIQNLKLKESIRSQDDLAHLCHTLRYWGVSGVPEVIIKAAFKGGINWTDVEKEFGSELVYIKTISLVRKLQASKRIETAIANGCLELVIALHKTKHRVPPKACVIAAAGGHLDIMKYFHQKEFSLHIGNDFATSAAAKGGYYDCLVYAHSRGGKWNEMTLHNAALGGHLKCLQFALKRRCPTDEWTTAYAARGGHLDCLKYLHEHGCVWESSTPCFASLQGHLHCLRYAHEHGCPWDAQTTAEASCGDHFDCLQYAYEHGCLWDDYTTQNAASSGSLACLQYAHERGCEWTIATTKCAAQNGHLDCLKYAHEHGCPWDYSTYKAAIDHKRQDCLEYIIKEGCPQTTVGSDIIKATLAFVACCIALYWFITFYVVDESESL